MMVNAMNWKTGVHSIVYGSCNPVSGVHGCRLMLGSSRLLCIQRGVAP